MHYTLEQGKQSNYQITLTLTAEELASHKEAALKQFQKDANIEWFRPGHAPLSMVEQRVSPEYVKVAMYEEALHKGTSQVVAEHTDKRFIGQMYNLSIDDKSWTDITMSFLIDVYPEVQEKNDARKKAAVKGLDTTISAEEIEETITNLKRQYADYQETTQVGPNSVFKVSLAFLDKSGATVHTGKLYLGKEDFAEFPQIVEYFLGKKEWDVVTISYDEEVLPPTMFVQKAWIEAASIEATIWDTKDMVLPEFTPENIKKFFGNDDVKTEEELREKIKGLMASQKEETMLMQAIDSYLQEAMVSFDLAIPKTLIEEEVKTRQKSLQERMGGEEWLKKYFEQIWEDEVAKLNKSITDAAQSSLEKFLLLKDIVEKLGITDINREAPLDVEKKLYNALTNK